MREVERHYRQQPRRALQRAADGRLKPAGGDRDIADIWAERERIKLAEAIAESQAKAAKKQRRKERGLLSWRKAKTKATQSSQSRDAQSSATPKEIEIKISVPKPDFAALVAKLRVLRMPKLSRSQWKVACSIVVLLMVFVVFPTGYDMLHSQPAAQHQGNHVAASTPIGGSQPNFTTVLPEGKTIQQLGGWGRVSPPDKDPVFAYSDMLTSVHVVVSEQSLPASFQSDPDGQMMQLAKQLSGTSIKLRTATASSIYVGTAINGSQSVIANKNGLLILARAASKIADDQWVSYVDSLQ
ncbi:MAG TPA: hypothetical protein VJP80_03450 [Candidatus Saccharimonadales bacterium]|nr:hypothetical protein [Candidatus Saccharimonadales bacterium]